MGAVSLLLLYDGYFTDMPRLEVEKKISGKQRESFTCYSSIKYSMQVMPALEYQLSHPQPIFQRDDALKELSIFSNDEDHARDGLTLAQRKFSTL